MFISHFCELDDYRTTVSLYATFLRQVPGFIEARLVTHPREGGGVDTEDSVH